MVMHITDKPYLETLVHVGELAHSAHHRHTELRARGEPCLQCTLCCYTDLLSCSRHVAGIHCTDCQLNIIGRPWPLRDTRPHHLPGRNLCNQSATRQSKPVWSTGSSVSHTPDWLKGHLITKHLGHTLLALCVLMCPLG